MIKLSTSQLFLKYVHSWQLIENTKFLWGSRWTMYLLVCSVVLLYIILKLWNHTLFNCIVLHWILWWVCIASVLLVYKHPRAQFVLYLVLTASLPLPSTFFVWYNISTVCVPIEFVMNDIDMCHLSARIMIMLDYELNSAAFPYLYHQTTHQWSM